jgi:flagellar biosynthesis protein FlhA
MISSRALTRVREIAARFVVDYWQVKIMAIETELSSGELTDEEAAIRKEAVQAESDFLGALDGAMNFISGNAKVCLLFFPVLIIAGGSIINVFFHEGVFIEALKYYMGISIGYGIIFIFPANSIVFLHFSNPYFKI